MFGREMPRSETLVPGHMGMGPKGKVCASSREGMAAVDNTAAITPNPVSPGNRPGDRNWRQDVARPLSSL